MTEFDLDLSLYEEKNVVSFAVPFNWVNPHYTKRGTPVEDGGIMVDVNTGISISEPFVVKNRRGDERQVTGTKELWIHPIKLGRSYYVVTDKTTEQERSYLYRGDFIPREQVPSGFDVKSALPFFFVLANDQSARLCVTIFKSHLASLFTKEYKRYVSEFHGASMREFGKMLTAAAVPAKLYVQSLMEVGKTQKSLIAVPGLWRDTKKTIREQMVSAYMMRSLVAHINTPELDEYPFNSAAVVNNVITKLPWDKEFKVLPPGSVIDSETVDDIL